MSGLRTDSIPLFDEVSVDGDSPIASTQNSVGSTYMIKGTGVGADVTVEFITLDPKGNEFVLNTDVLTATRPTAKPLLISGKYTQVFSRLTGITAGTYSGFLNVRREV